MSVKIMGKVWDMELAPSEKLALLALADHADHEGANVRPGTQLLAKKTGLSVRQIQRIIDKFELAGIIRKSSGGVGRGQKAHYEFVPDKMTPCHLIKPAKDDTLSPYKKTEKVTPCHLKEKIKGDICDTEKVTPATIKGDIPRARAEERARLNHHEPSIESSSARARKTDDDDDFYQAEKQNGNGHRSKFKEPVCLEFVEAIVTQELEVRNPPGLARAIYISGNRDPDIEAWINSGKKLPAKKHKGRAQII